MSSQPSQQQDFILDNNLIVFFAALIQQQLQQHQHQQQQQQQQRQQQEQQQQQQIERQLQLQQQIRRQHNLQYEQQLQYQQQQQQQQAFMQNQQHQRQQHQQQQQHQNNPMNLNIGTLNNTQALRELLQQHQSNQSPLGLHNDAATWSALLSAQLGQLGTNNQPMINPTNTVNSNASTPVNFQKQNEFVNGSSIVANQLNLSPNQNQHYITTIPNNGIQSISPMSSPPLTNNLLNQQRPQSNQALNCPSSSLLSKLNAVTQRPDSHVVANELDSKMIDLLEAFYTINDNPEPAAIEMIARRINVNTRCVANWFDRKRLKLNPFAGPRSPPAKKREGGRVVTFSEYQRSLLEAIFIENNYLHPQEYEELSNLIQVPSRNIKIWFKNRRSKQRLTGRTMTSPQCKQSIANENHGHLNSSDDL